MAVGDDKLYPGTTYIKKLMAKVHVYALLKGAEL